jgi:hypothetical protein
VDPVGGRVAAGAVRTVTGGGEDSDCWQGCGDRQPQGGAREGESPEEVIGSSSSRAGFAYRPEVSAGGAGLEAPATGPRTAEASCQRGNVFVQRHEGEAVPNGHRTCPPTARDRCTPETADEGGAGWSGAQPERASEGEGAEPARKPARVARHGGHGLRPGSAVAHSGHGVPVHDRGLWCICSTHPGLQL